MPTFSQVSCHIVHCYAVASQFEKCREKIAEMQIIVQELCRLLYYKVCLLLLLFSNNV
jgi:DnaJ family protein C protein 13